MLRKRRFEAECPPEVDQVSGIWASYCGSGNSAFYLLPGECRV